MAHCPSSALQRIIILGTPSLGAEGSVQAAGSIDGADQSMDPSTRKGRGSQDDKAVFKAFVSDGQRVAEIHVQWHHVAVVPAFDFERCATRGSRAESGRIAAHCPSSALQRIIILGTPSLGAEGSVQAAGSIDGADQSMDPSTRNGRGSQDDKAVFAKLRQWGVARRSGPCKSTTACLGRVEGTGAPQFRKWKGKN